MRFGFGKRGGRKIFGRRKAASVQHMPTLSDAAQQRLKDQVFETLSKDPQWQSCRGLVKLSLDPPGLVLVMDHPESPGLFVLADAVETEAAETLQADYKRRLASMIEQATSELIAQSPGIGKTD